MATKGRSDLDEELDDLFRLPLAEFTSARNALAKQLKKTGRSIDSERVKSLAKPPATAWAVNQLYWQNPQAIEQLIFVAARARQTQAGRLKNANLSELLEEKKRLMAGLLERATTILSAAGHAAAPDTLRRVSATLESLAVWGKTAGIPEAGRLTADLDPPGFEALAELMEEAPDAGKVLLFRTAKQDSDAKALRARAREALQAAEKVLREAQHDAGRAQTALAKANAHVTDVEAQKHEIEVRYAKAKEEARVAANEAERAAQTVADAERSVARAKAELA